MRGARRLTIGMAAALCAPLAAAADGPSMIALPAATYRAVTAKATEPAKAVAPYRLDRVPVTNAEFLAFVEANPSWRRDRAPAVVADDHYLAGWSGPLTLGSQAPAQAPVVGVSWFAARAYCASRGARLPSEAEWELAAAASPTERDGRRDPVWRQTLIDWYARPNPARLPAVGQQRANAWGLHDMHGLVWEWVSDYASLMVAGDNRDQGDPDLLKFCGAGALTTQDRDNYAVLMRVALLSSLKAADTTANLGFRCAMDDTP